MNVRCVNFYGENGNSTLKFDGNSTENEQRLKQEWEWECLYVEMRGMEI